MLSSSDSECDKYLSKEQILRRREVRKRKKPEQLRKEIFEVFLRKRIFLTDRTEKVEKLL